MTALLLGGGLQALSVAYSLHKIGWLVLVFSTEPMFRFSASVSKTISFELSADNLIAQATSDNVDVIIPMSDKYTLWLANHRMQIESRTKAKCATPSIDSLKIACNKALFTQFCINNSYPCPKTEIATLENYAEKAALVGYPLLIKPDNSVGAQGITKVYSNTELKDKISAVITRFGSCTLQEFIDNRHYYFNVMLYRYADGTFAQEVITKIYRFYPKGGGSSSCCVTIEDTKLTDICRHVLDSLNWIGFADFDVLYDIAEKEYKLIEINPRVPASLKAADISGVNFPQIIVEDLMYSNKPVMNYTTGYRLRYLGLDFLWFLASLKNMSVTTDWFKFFGNKIYYQDLYQSSPFLAIGILIHGIKRLQQKIVMPTKKR